MIQGSEGWTTQGECEGPLAVQDRNEEVDKAHDFKEFITQQRQH